MLLSQNSILGLVGVSISLCSLANAQAARGTVTDTSGKPIAGAEVRFISPNGRATVATDRIPPEERAFGLSAPPPDGRYIIYYLAVCADGYAPQVVTAPFARGDTLRVAVQLVRTTSRSIAPLAPGACAWNPDPVDRITVEHTGAFPAEAALTAAATYAVASKKPRDTAAARVYLDRVIAQRDSALRAATSADARAQAAYMMIGPLGSYTGPDAGPIRSRALSALPADSRWWVSQANWVQWGVATLFDAPERTDTTPAANILRANIQAYLERMTSIGEPEIRSEARGALVRYMYAAGDSARGQLLLTQLMKEQPDYPWSKLVASFYGNATLLRTGKKLPVFTFPPLPDTSGKHITNAALVARFTLIEFWGTWCGPCVGELPALSKLYATYHPAGLEILSVAAEATPETVNEFRRTKYPMPWINAFGGDTQAPALQHLGVIVYPTAVLVDSTGTIVASQGALLPPVLDATIKRFLTP